MASIRSRIGENMKDRCLFKAKTCNGKWISGFLHCKENKWYINNKAGSPFAFEVRPNTICQCTGLKDKNGKLIWENEIIKCKFGIAVAVWDKSEWRIKCVKDNIWRKDLHYWVVEDNQRTEVIGNKFDNPELLEA